MGNFRKDEINKKKSFQKDGDFKGLLDNDDVENLHTRLRNRKTKS
jgi:hypothetical protein